MNRTEMIFIRSELEPLAPFGNLQAGTNVSRSWSFSFVGEHGKEIINGKGPPSMEFFIPRDPYRISPPMILQDVISRNRTFDWKSIKIKEYQPNEHLSISLHFHIEPVNRSDLGYLFLYHFDQDYPLVSLDQSRNWTILCPSGKAASYVQRHVSLSLSLSCPCRSDRREVLCLLDQ